METTGGIQFFFSVNFYYSFFMAMEYCPHDLKNLMEKKMKTRFSQSEVKCLMLQLLDAIAFLHENWVIHR